VSRGATGSAPEWHGDVLAAKQLGVSILDFYELPFYWRERALLMLDAEGYAHEEEIARLKQQQRLAR
jgi:hypothetical protein